jgi:two-component system phosphate regulon sensor histidine kinase PhoR
MKHNRTTLFITVSSIALLLVLIIQVNWLFQTAKSKEELFNEKSNMVLARTTEALLADKEICTRIESGNSGNTMHAIDSTFMHYMKFYGFYVDYSFEIVKPNPIETASSETTENKRRFTNGFNPNQMACYQHGLEKVKKENGWELRLILPEKKEFIIQEMGTLFITSVILILIVLVMFWRTTKSLLQEKKLSEHTTDFLNNMTHEFKTPLTNIALAGKMIIKDPAIKEEDKIKLYSEIILEENEKLRLQVEQVLSMTALERGEIPLRKTELDVHLLIRDSLKYIGLQIEHKQGNLKLKLEAENFVVMGDKTHLANALSNLVDNAIKYAREKLELSILTFNKDHRLVLVFSDKGVGIEKEYHKKVFDKFFRVPTGDVHDVKGFGLGLAYTKKIVEMHGGTIELESEIGERTTFIITLPHV